MDRLPATNRWPKWARNTLWAVGALGLVTLGLALPIVVRSVGGLSTFFIRENAEGTAAFALLLQAVVFIGSLLYVRRQIHDTRAISARTN